MGDSQLAASYLLLEKKGYSLTTISLLPFSYQ